MNSPIRRCSSSIRGCNRSFESWASTDAICIWGVMELLHPNPLSCGPRHLGCIGSASRCLQTVNGSPQSLRRWELMDLYRSQGMKLWRAHKPTPKNLGWPRSVFGDMLSRDSSLRHLRFGGLLAQFGQTPKTNGKMQTCPKCFNSYPWEPWVGAWGLDEIIKWCEIQCGERHLCKWWETWGCAVAPNGIWPPRWKCTRGIHGSTYPEWYFPNYSQIKPMGNTHIPRVWSWKIPKHKEFQYHGSPIFKHGISLPQKNKSLNHPPHSRKNVLNIQ